MDKTCDGCGKTSEDVEDNKFYRFRCRCRVCREILTLCGTCMAIAQKEQKCIDCLNDGR